MTLVFSIAAFVYMIININHRAPHDKVLGLYVLLDSPEFLDESEDSNKPSNVLEQEEFDRGS